ncbi:MAG: PorT family protein [Muribaculaceae bacterium]|nr:PorT family protein [Muribaculaceae bacterium]
MKKIPAKLITTVVAIILATIAVNAQSHYRANLTVGVKAGADISRMFFNPGVNQGLKPGATAGVSFRYVEEEHFGLIAELNWVQRGWKENFEGAPYRYSRTLNYLQLPILAHIYFGRRGRFFFNAGPEIGVLLAESTSANFNPAEMAALPDFPNTNRMNVQMTLKAKHRFDYGISAGLGAEFNVTPKHAVAFEARFYYGLGNLFSSERTAPFSGSNSMAVSATLGYLFRLR